jgi:Domain of Unknown Function (DUF928)
MNTKSLLLASGCLIGLSALMAPMALADYQPPRRLTPPRTQTSSAGVRVGECAKPPVALTPQNHMGQTTATHPTFAWQIPEAQAHPIEFRLYRYSANETPQLITQMDLGKSLQGIMTWTLPDTEPGLNVKSQYYWQIAIICNANDPSQDVYDDGELEVVTLPDPLKNQLDTHPDLIEQADLYARSGLWYDALAIVLRSPDPRSRMLRRSMVEYATSQPIE